MSSRCFCGVVFGTPYAFDKHVLSQGHSIQCSCGSLFGHPQDLYNHWRDSDHVKLEHEEQDLVHEDGPVECVFCDREFDDLRSLQQHVSKKHYSCPACNQVFNVKEHCVAHRKSTEHYYCAQHDEFFVSKDDVRVHRRTIAHIGTFECTDCQRSFRTDQALKDHLNSRGHGHVAAAAADKKFFGDMAAKKLEELEETNLYCNACNQKFNTLKAFSQHKSSPKHNPLSELKCPLSKECNGTFSSPSALLFHLESGKCKGGMTRNNLNAVVYQHDTARHITMSEHSQRVLDAAMPDKSCPSIVPNDSASNYDPSMPVDFGTTSHTGGTPSASAAKATDATSTLGVESGVILTPEDSNTSTMHDSDTESSTSTVIITSADDDVSSALDIGGLSLDSDDSSTTESLLIPTSTTISDGGIILSPSASEDSSALSGWSFLNSSRKLTPAPSSLDGSSTDTICYDEDSQSWPCPTCSETFRKKHDLVQHINSIVHSPKIFRCPTDLPGLSGSRKPTLCFKTLSGLAQHVEAGSCKGGNEALQFIIGVFEKQIQAKLGASVKLLKG